MLRIGWFSSGRGPGSRDLLRAVMESIGSGGLDAEVSFAFCNWSNGEADNPRREQREMFFDMVRGYGIPLVSASWKEFRPDLRASDPAAWRDGYGELLRDSIRGFGFDLGVLAGYMLWMDDRTCEEYGMINLHPALPGGPKGTWEEVIWSLIRDGAEEHGAMIHACTRDWDRGDAVAFCRFPIRGPGFDRLWEGMAEKLESSTLEEVAAREGAEEPLFKKIREEGRRREVPLTVAAIGMFADGSARIEGGRLVRGCAPADGPVDLSAEVDASLAGCR
ncbi:MAG: phosphoribosylglycinamide formyltransferase [Candidatus Methanoplasma sp.]|jgi:phosphoribosylglycinamide formyltransferase-1|nr:phosphoribosylglycinamide formyltransferase [Candidatus Methanoplasma sp.]